MAILAAQAAGGLAAVLTKLALRGFDPWTMVCLRQLLGLAVLLAIARARPSSAPSTPFTRSDWGLLLIASWGGFALPQILLAVGIDRSTGTMGALLTPLEPIGIVLGSILWLGEKLTLVRGIAIAVGTLGALLVVGQGTLDPTLGNPLGDLTIAIGHLAWASYTIATKPLLSRHDPMRITIAVVMLSLVPIGALATTETLDVERAKEGLVWLVALALLGTAFGTWTWNFALRHTSAGTMAAFIFLQPVVGLAAGVLALGEPVGSVAIVGAALVASAVVIEARGSRKPTPSGPDLL